MWKDLRAQLFRRLMTLALMMLFERQVELCTLTAIREPLPAPEPT